jgi:tRNA 2-(methylsulfanyl)-N6-isopentenyladenosine37 hydroxylase
MLGLQLPTDPTWVKNVVEGNISEILTDHAYCEQKAASHAISLILTFPEYPELVDVMADLAQEEMAHFKLVHALIQQRGFELGRERKDDYVGELMKFVRRGRGHDILLMDRLLFAAMIEARSCERFKVLHDHISDRELAQFYYDLMASEARHYTTFLKLAKQYLDPEAVEARWKEWLAYEAESSNITASPSASTAERP